MGADLYIEKIHQPLIRQYEPLLDAALERRNAWPPKPKAYRKAQRQITSYCDLMHSAGYFRDSYNVTNVLNRLNLSWWRDVSPLLTPERKLRGKQLRKFRDQVVAAKLTLPAKSDLEKEGGTVEEQGQNSVAGWHQYFSDKHVELVSFLNQAIELDSAIHCSL